MVGQEHVVAALCNALQQNRVPHAFLFTGTRGVGKTTLARLFAKALNCEQGVSAEPCGACASCEAIKEGRYVDLIEVDAASRTKVEDTRELLDNVQYAPTSGRYKVYLIDEVHMLSSHSFNALLKTLEEPPEHVKFLLATTDPQKLPMTILSRCIQFTLRALETPEIEQQLARILRAESLNFEQSALTIIARFANGSMRDALSLLDQSIAFGGGEVKEAALRHMMGMVDSGFTQRVLQLVLQQEQAKVLGCVAEMVALSVDFSAALDDLLSLIHACVLVRQAPKALNWTHWSSDDLTVLLPLADIEVWQLYYQLLLVAKRDFSLAPDSRIGFEMALMRLMAFAPESIGSSSTLTAPGVLGNKPASDSRPIESTSNQALEQSFAEPSKGAVVTKNAPKSGAASAVERLAAKAKSEAKPSNSAGDAPSSMEESKGGIPPWMDEPPPIEASFQPPTHDVGGKQTEPIEPPLVPAKNVETDIKPSARVEGGEDSGRAIKDLQNPASWTDLIESTTMPPLAKQLAMQMVFLSLESQQLKVAIDNKYAGQVRSPARKTAIENALREAIGQPLELLIQTQETDHSQTAAGVRAAQKSEAKQQMQQTFQNDPHVQELAEIFDAEVDISSIH